MTGRHFFPSFTKEGTMRESIYEKTVELRQELHNHPELSMEEVETKRRLMEFLKDNAPADLSPMSREDMLHHML